MKKQEFQEWLISHGVCDKMIKDHLSRVARFERALSKARNISFSLEDEFEKDLCNSIYDLFRHCGLNPQMSKYGVVDLPIGKTSMACIKHSVKTYVLFLSEHVRT